MEINNLYEFNQSIIRAKMLITKAKDVGKQIALLEKDKRDICSQLNNETSAQYDFLDNRATEYKVVKR